MEIKWLLAGEPRPVQMRALELSIDKMGWGHFLEMRLGKTPLVLNEFMLLRNAGLTDRMVVISPNSYKYEWQAAAKQFEFDEEVVVWESGRTKTAPGNVLIINYEAIRTDAGFSFVEKFLGEKGFLVADESVLLKNPKSKVFRAAAKLAKLARFRRALSGLPCPQGPQDFWAQLRFLGYNVGNYYAFKTAFCVFGGYMNKRIVGTRNEERLRDLLAASSFRATRDEWGERIPCDYEIVKVEMTLDQQKAYKTMDEDFVAYLESGEDIHIQFVITKQMKLQQITSGFIIDEAQGVHTLTPMAAVPKYKDLLFKLENQIEGKTVVIAHYRHTVASLWSHLETFEPAIIAGGEQMRQMGKTAKDEVERFTNDPNCRVIVAQAQAVKYGYNLRANGDCRSMCFYENTYSLDTRSQCEERPQGVGQKSAVYVWDYVSGTADMNIIRALQKKTDIAQAILDGYVRPREV